MFELGDKEWATRLYKKSEGKAETSDDFRSLGNSVYKNLGKKEWAKEIYKKAEGKAETSYDFDSLASSIKELGDKKWAKLVEQTAKELSGDDVENDDDE